MTGTLWKSHHTSFAKNITKYKCLTRKVKVYGEAMSVVHVKSSLNLRLQFARDFTSSSVISCKIVFSKHLRSVWNRRASFILCL